MTHMKLRSGSWKWPVSEALKYFHVQVKPATQSQVKEWRPGGSVGKAHPGREKGQCKDIEMGVVCAGGRGWGWQSMGDGAREGAGVPCQAESGLSSKGLWLLP